MLVLLMDFVTTITQKGQVTIPKQVRDVVGLSVGAKVKVQRKGKSILVLPHKDIASLAGVFQSKALKNKSINDVLALEEKAIEKGMLSE